MNPRLHPSRNSTGGFTLVEVLVSIVVLGLMMVGVAQMMNSALSATLGGYKHMDADTQARMVLDRMAFDISRMTKRSDIDYYFQKNSTSSGAPNYGNDQMAFYSESGGYYPTGVSGTTGASDVSLIGYMIINNQLCRLSKGLGWNGYNTSNPAMVFNPLANANSSSTPNTTLITNNSLTANWPGITNGTDSNYQVIGDQVFRLEYCFLVQTSPTSSSQTITLGGFYDYPCYYSSSYTSDTTPNGLKDVTAIVVSIAVLDTKSRALVSNAALQTAASDLGDDQCSSVVTYSSSTTSSNALPLYLWEKQLATSNLGLPKIAASQVRFYQRFCYLNHLQ